MKYHMNIPVTVSQTECDTVTSYLGTIKNKVIKNMQAGISVFFKEYSIYSRL
jgi:hypothetical protein